MSEDKGTFICYEATDFTKKSLDRIHAANHVIAEYESQGLMLTLRQLYYQFVARNWISNSQRSYDALGKLISKARIAGLVSWTALEDRNRQLMGVTTFEGPAHAVRHVAKRYAIDMWANQDWRPEVWVEKAALEGVISGICNKHRVDFFSTRGYNSQTAQWEAGRRFAECIRRGQRPIVFHLGDHDPSGIDMTRDNRDRLSMFAGVPVMVQRLALNMSQIEQYDPPPNPLKLKDDGSLSDSRAKDYQQQYGDSSWELDALAPDVVSKLIADALERLKDPVRWQEMVEIETDDKQRLEDAIESMGDFGEDD